MPCWYYDREHLEAIDKNSSLDWRSLRRLRFEATRAIHECGQKLGINFDTCATAVLYFQRFYTVNSFEKYDRYLVAAACIFLAGKVEETPKKSRNIIEAFKSRVSSQVFANFGSNPKETLLATEKVLISTLNFDFYVEHPYQYLIKFAKQITNLDQKLMQKLVKVSWTFINDSMTTTLCLEWEPDLIALSALYLGSKVIKAEITEWE
ncbi:MAG: hypothetical protein MHPSP_003069, partial [Paramarteilia canceri]